jgi:DNA repair protein RadC
MNSTENRPLSLPRQQTGIKAWDEADRPREKMLTKGKSSLTDAELVAIMIGSGTVNENAIALAERILQSVNGDLSELGRRSLKDLMKFKGIGEAKAITIAAALEIGRRRQFSDMIQRESILCSRDVYDVMLPKMIDLSHEEFWVLLLNQSNHIIGKSRISSGGVVGVFVDAKMVFKPAIEALAPSIVLVHNHPSGNLKPSKEDIELTRKLQEAGKNLDVKVMDHVIVSHSGFFSFRDDGLF